MIDLTSVGTLFAFVLVCGGVLRMSLYPHPPKSAFKTPYLNAAYFMPVILLAVVVLLWIYAPDTYANMLRFPEFSWQREYLDAVLHKIIYILFALLFVGLTLLSVWKKLSLIPVLGLLSCSYLLCESGVSNWSRFLLWLLVGVVIYFAYGYRNSKLSRTRS